jgi:hypothetical protein
MRDLPDIMALPQIGPRVEGLPGDILRFATLALQDAPYGPVAIRHHGSRNQFLRRSGTPAL